MTYQPFTNRLIRSLADTFSVPPVVTGVACSLLLGGFALWFLWMIGIVSDVISRGAPSIALRATVTLYLLLGLLPMSIYYQCFWTVENLQAIARQFDLDLPPLVFPRLLANLFGVVGVIVVHFSFAHEPEDPWRLFEPSRWPDDLLLPLVGLAFMGWFYFRFSLLLVWSALKISRTARDIQSIDLLDPAMVKTYAQHGVSSSLLAVVSLSVTANLWMDPDSPAIGTIMALVLLVGAAVVALVLPTWGIHKRLKEVKQVELKQIRTAIASRLDPDARSLEDAQQLRTDLALEQRVNEISEWPFDTGSYGRVALYLFLGVGSWVGAALVEQMLDSL